MCSLAAPLHTAVASDMCTAPASAAYSCSPRQTGLQVLAGLVLLAHSGRDDWTRLNVFGLAIPAARSPHPTQRRAPQRNSPLLLPLLASRPAKHPHGISALLS